MTNTLKLVLHGADNADRLAMMRAAIATPWHVEWANSNQDAAHCAAAFADADAVLAMNWNQAMPPAPKLRLLQLPGAGWDGIDMAAVPAHAAICNAYEHEIGIAEYVVGAILAWETRLLQAEPLLRRGDWSHSLFGGGGLHGELYGKTVGIVGLGRIGRETAQRLKAFGVRLLACTRSPQKNADCVDQCNSMAQLPVMLAACDYVLIACPLSDETHGLIDAPALAAMRVDGVIINVARGPVIDETALFQALSQRQIGGAIIDTWYQYPRPGESVTFPSRHPFHHLPNLIMTPHMSGLSAGLMRRRLSMIGQNMDRLYRNEALLNVIREGQPL